MRGDPKVLQHGQFCTPYEVISALFGTYCIGGLADKVYLHLFRAGIQPLWEDPRNAKGGHLKLLASSPAQSEAMWRTLVQHFTKEDFPDCEFINGLSIMPNHSGNSLIKVWLAQAEKGVVRRVRAFLRGALNPQDHLAFVSFVPHRIVMKGAKKAASEAQLPLQSKGLRPSVQKTAGDYIKAPDSPRDEALLDTDPWVADICGLCGQLECLSHLTALHTGLGSMAEFLTGSWDGPAAGRLPSMPKLAWEVAA